MEYGGPQLQLHRQLIPIWIWISFNNCIREMRYAAWRSWWAYVRLNSWKLQILCHARACVTHSEHSHLYIRGKRWVVFRLNHLRRLRRPHHGINYFCERPSAFLLARDSRLLISGFGDLLLFNAHHLILFKKIWAIHCRWPEDDVTVIYQRRESNMRHFMRSTCCSQSKFTSHIFSVQRRRSPIMESAVFHSSSAPVIGSML